MYENWEAHFYLYPCSTNAFAYCTQLKVSQPAVRSSHVLHCTIQGVITFSRMEWYHKRLHMHTSQQSHLVDQNSYAYSLCTWTPNPKLMPPISTERANCSTARPAFSEGVGKGATLLPPPGFNPTFLICRHKIKLHTIVEPTLWLGVEPNAWKDFPSSSALRMSNLQSFVSFLAEERFQRLGCDPSHVQFS